MAQLALFNEGVRDHLPICENFRGNFLRDFFADGGTRPFICVGARMSFHALVIDMVLAKGAGIPAPSDTIDVC